MLKGLVVVDVMCKIGWTLVPILQSNSNLDVTVMYCVDMINVSNDLILNKADNPR